MNDAVVLLAVPPTDLRRRADSREPHPSRNLRVLLCGGQARSARGFSDGWCSAACASACGKVIDCDRERRQRPLRRRSKRAGEPVRNALRHCFSRSRAKTPVLFASALSDGARWSRATGPPTRFARERVVRKISRNRVLERFRGAAAVSDESGGFVGQRWCGRAAAGFEAPRSRSVRRQRGGPRRRTGARLCAGNARCAPLSLESRLRALSEAPKSVVEDLPAAAGPMTDCAAPRASRLLDRQRWPSDCRSNLDPQEHVAESFRVASVLFGYRRPRRHVRHQSAASRSFAW